MDYIKCFERYEIKKDILDFLEYFYCNKYRTDIHRSLYIYGEHGIGKSEFIKDILDKNTYNLIYINSIDVNNKHIINDILNNQISDTCVLSSFYKKKQSVIVLDDVYNSSVVDKSLISNIIKFIRPKKTKKQKLEVTTMIPIIFINQLYTDKKIKELMKVTKNVYIPTPTREQIYNFSQQYILNIGKDYGSFKNKLDEMIDRENGNIFKIKIQLEILSNNPKNKIDNVTASSEISKSTTDQIYIDKYFSMTTREIIRDIIFNKPCLDNHLFMMNETDRTSISLFFYENIIDFLSDDNKLKHYKSIIENISKFDFVDRVMYQKQIWILNEISSILKNIYNPFLYHKVLENIPQKFFDDIIKKRKTISNPDNIRFTKVLTKYSTEYNNHIFLNSMSQRMLLDRDKLLFYFQQLREKNNVIDYDELEQKQISKLDINRIYRFIDQTIG